MYYNFQFFINLCKYKLVHIYFKMCHELQFFLSKSSNSKDCILVILSKLSKKKLQLMSLLEELAFFRLHALEYFASTKIPHC